MPSQPVRIASVGAYMGVVPVVPGHYIGVAAVVPEPDFLGKKSKWSAGMDRLLFALHSSLFPHFTVQ